MAIDGDSHPDWVLAFTTRPRPRPGLTRPGRPAGRAVPLRLDGPARPRYDTDGHDHV